MYDLNLIAIDLAKSSFQVCVLDKQNKERLNRAMTRKSLDTWLEKQPPSIVAMESCGSAHYWARKAKGLGHQVMLLHPKFVKKFLQGHKTDKNDATAIAIAARQPNVKPVSVKSPEQSALQGCDRIRQHYQDELTATSNLVRGLLYEFGITFAKGKPTFVQAVPFILEDAENGLPDPLRGELARLYERWLMLNQQLREIAARQTQRIKQNPICQKLKALEGVGEVNALALYLTLGERGEGFKHGREAAACIGLTPKQHSTGGKTVLLGISKKVAKKTMRANLIQGALAKVRVLNKRPPKNAKEAWLKALIERRGLRRAAVALANKTIRTAWAMLHNNTEYREPQAI